MGEGIIGIWHCSSCGERNLGRLEKCQKCGHAKGASEVFEMPLDTSAAPSVTAVALLRIASRGPDWRCAYCGSDQRAESGGCSNCGAPASKGAEVPEDKPPPPPTRSEPVPGSVGPTRPVPVYVWILGVLCLFGMVSVLCSKKPDPVPEAVPEVRDYPATVTAVKWDRSIVVYRYAKRQREGVRKDIPKNATGIKRAGSNVHPTDAVTFTYYVRDWEPDRVVRSAGTDVVGLKWPENGARRAGFAGLAKGEQEREQRSASYVVTIMDASHTIIRFHVYEEAHFVRFAPGTQHKVHYEYNGYFVDDISITPL